MRRVRWGKNLVEVGFGFSFSVEEVMIVLVVVVGVGVGVVLRVREATSSDRPIHQVLLISHQEEGGIGIIRCCLVFKHGFLLMCGHTVRNHF